MYELEDTQVSGLTEVEVLADDARHICTSVADRYKKPLDDFYALLAKPGKYSDQEFAPGDSSLSWADMGEKSIVKGAEVTWKRAYDLFGQSDSLFGDDGISNDDIAQGSLGDCWFLSAASAIAEYPSRLQ